MTFHPIESETQQVTQLVQAQHSHCSRPETLPIYFHQISENHIREELLSFGPYKHKFNKENELFRERACSIYGMVQ
jgi:hypothetical protein